MPGDAALATYYARRAEEYERIYHKPERQADLASLQSFFTEKFTGRDVLELACGTGWWTRVIARTARSITASDINEEVLEIARVKEFGDCPVRFVRGDAFNCSTIPGEFNAGLAGFWWSHLKRSQCAEFLREFRRALRSGALAVLLDNRFVAGSSTPIARTDEEGNTYQLRRLDNGETHEVLKNFPNEGEVRHLLGEVGVEIQWHVWDYFWCATCKMK